MFKVKREVTLGQVITWLLMILSPTVAFLYGIWDSELATHGKVAYTNSILIAFLVGSILLYHWWEWDEEGDKEQEEEK